MQHFMFSKLQVDRSSQSLCYRNIFRVPLQPAMPEGFKCELADGLTVLSYLCAARCCFLQGWARRAGLCMVRNALKACGA